MRVFLDVTGSCRSSKNTGIQRVTRQIFGTLGSQVVTPICWNHLGGYFHVLRRRELDRLVSPFDHLRSPVARPELRGEKFFGELRRLVGSHKIDFAAGPDKGGVLLVTDIFTDGRIELLPQLGRQGAFRLVAIFHDAANLRLGLFSQKAAQGFRRYVETLALFNLVICISNESRLELIELWKEYGIASQPETSVEWWPIEFPEANRALNRTRSRNVVLCVGSLEQRKNHLTLLDAASQLWNSGAEFELHMIGRSAGKWGPRVLKKIRELEGLGRPLWWHKHVNDEALHKAYRECRFTVYPSVREGFGLPVLESLWHGRPCICGNNGALGEIGSGGGCLFVDQTSASDLAQGMERLLTDQNLYDRFCAEARQRKFGSWSDYCERLRESVGVSSPVHRLEPGAQSLARAVV